MYILGIDSTCDDSCAAIYDTERCVLLSDVVYTHTKAMQGYGGIVPELASREHVRFVPIAAQQALQKAGLTPAEIDWVAVTNRPGLVGSLIVGVAFAKSLAFGLKKPLAALDHVEAHLYSALLSSTPPPPAFPWICLVVSGGHTELFEVTGIGEHRWMGGTLDDAAGEAFDKVGKLLGFGYPAGPVIDRLVRESASAEDFTAYSFPRAKTSDLEFSFSGFKTAVLLAIQRAQPLDDAKRLGLAASAQEAILDALVTRIQAAQRRTGIQNVVVTGGVACNSRLRRKLAEAFFPEPRHCSDNAGMVASLAAHYLNAGKLRAETWDLTAMPRADWAGV